jgi:DNA-binding SARP family transcriptional activator
MNDDAGKPCRSRRVGLAGYVRLMRLHIGRGNRAEALRAYEQCRAILAHDLGVTPSPQTKAVYREVLGP